MSPQYLPDSAGLPANDLIEEMGAELAARFAGAEDELIRQVAVRAYRDLELQEIVRTTTMSDHMGGLLSRSIARNRALAELAAHRAQTIRDLQYLAAQMAGKLKTKQMALDVITLAWQEGEAAAAARLGMATWLPATSAISGTSSQASTMLTMDLTSRLEAMALRIARYPQDAYQRIISFTATNTLLGATTSLRMQQASVQQFLAEGITGFTDKAGRNWRIGSYAEMAGRTAVNRVFNDAGVWRMQQQGVNLVTVQGGLDSCSKCAPWVGKILSTDGTRDDVEVQHATKDERVIVTIAATLDAARSAGLMHPNCRHKATAYLPGLSIPQAGQEYSAQAEADREMQRSIERDIRAAKRAQSIAPDAAARAKATAKIKAKQGQIREHLAATGRPRASFREQLHFAQGK
ncbi:MULTISPECIES: phage minor capsid protein [Cryobacterium]|uniref:Minor capsid protein n=1 Tax=Cryobacterium breve TaxID=1259258 RepID=A0ABY2J7Z1_9MICO|nr:MULTISPECIES: phage minor capsid protein [Cryobacterium]TFC92050.1 hypothetical protein E3T20_12105 [Cryobacterium sp. TmT3-12]TFC99811.1 hypothetical protein E3O65_05400 [Cryobacterium breve]